MKTIPKVMKYMTTTPITINGELPLQQAIDTMNSNGIRHLPVLKNGKIIGILSDRDVKMVLGFKDIDPQKVTVEEACTFDPLSVSPEAPLDEVVTLMAEKKIGSVLIVDNHKLVGIFTWIDALQALAEILNQRFHH